MPDEVREPHATELPPMVEVGFSDDAELREAHAEWARQWHGDRAQLFDELRCLIGEWSTWGSARLDLETSRVIAESGWEASHG